jgi:hypothetical protein
MEFPILIENEPHLARLIRTVAKEVVAEITPVKTTPLMSKQECYDEVGRVLVDRAIKNGNLKVHSIEGRVVIKRQEFNKWIEKL